MCLYHVHVIWTVAVSDRLPKAVAVQQLAPLLMTKYYVERYTFCVCTRYVHMAHILCLVYVFLKNKKSKHIHHVKINTICE